MVARPFFFGMLASLLTHRLLGGVGKGEITDFKSAIGSIQVSGPIAVLFFSILATQAMFLAENLRPVAGTKPQDKELTIFSNEEAQGAIVSLTINNTPRLNIKPRYSSLFKYFIDRCYLGKSSGCKTPVRFIANDSIAQPGTAIICEGSISGVKITISGRDTERKGLVSPLAVSLFAEPSCSLEKNTLYISTADARTSNIKLDKSGTGDGFISPFLGQIKLPSRPPE